MVIPLSKVFRKMLKLIYGFDNWHVSPLAERPYAQDVIKYCNALVDRSAFFEIGCGLGDITRNVYFENRRGFDMDGKVLRAARILPSVGKGKPNFTEFTFPETELKGRTNVLTMVNWIHHVEPEILKKMIARYFDQNLEPGGRILVDTVQDPAYKYNHRIDDLIAGLPCSKEKIGSYKRQREVWAIIKTM